MSNSDILWIGFFLLSMSFIGMLIGYTIGHEEGYEHGYETGKKHGQTIR